MCSSRNSLSEAFPRKLGTWASICKEPFSCFSWNFLCLSVRFARQDVYLGKYSGASANRAVLVGQVCTTEIEKEDDEKIRQSFDNFSHNLLLKVCKKWFVRKKNIFFSYLPFYCTFYDCCGLPLDNDWFIQVMWFFFFIINIIIKIFVLLNV